MAGLSHGCPGPVAEPLLTCLGSGLPTSPLTHRVPRDSTVNLTHPQELATPEPLAARSKPHQLSSAAQRWEAECHQDGKA